MIIKVNDTSVCNLLIASNYNRVQRLDARSRRRRRRRRRASACSPTCNVRDGVERLSVGLTTSPPLYNGACSS